MNRWRISLSAMLLLTTTVSYARTSSIAACHSLADAGNEAAHDCYLTLLQTEENDALRAEALWRTGNIAAANRAFRRAVELTPDNPDILARWGMLYLDAHQAADAEALFKEALALDANHIGALLGTAELLVDRFRGPARSVIEQILELDPNNHRAQILLARLEVEAANLSQARSILFALVEPETTGEISLRHQLEAMALLAAADHMSGSANVSEAGTPSPWTAKALALNPRYGDIYAVPAYFYVITRRYREAVALLEQAVEVDPRHWSAHTALGTNLLRVNRIDEGQQHLQTAYAGDAFNAETVNTLRLLDTLETFDVQTSDALVLRTHPDETAVLTPYVAELVEKTITEMADRYGYELERPMVLELYQHHDDFGVRTAGLPGLGILGATFGDVVVMDGPSAKNADSFDWYSAVWHEFAHVVTLNATDNLVSRWFSEGVSVHEEQRFGPSPNASVPIDFLDAMAAEQLLPVAELDQGFMRPQYPNQIGVSYVQAGLLCSFIADNFDSGLTRILERYHAGDATVAAIENGLGVKTTELDARFFAHLDAQFGAAASGAEELRSQIKAADAAIRAEQWAAAFGAAERAIELFPDYIGSGSGYVLKARAAEGLEDLAASRQAVLDYHRLGGRAPGALSHGAKLLEEAGARKDALAIQRTLVRLDPLKAEHHARLGGWLTESKLHAEALTEYQAVLALAPHDKATAHFQVASTLHELHRTEEARRQLLYALEIAPRFSPALALLVEINQ